MSSFPKVELAAVAEIFQGVPTALAGSSPDHRFPILNPRDLAPPGPPPLELLDRVAIKGGARGKRAVVHADDVLVTARGTQLRAAFVPHETAGAIASANLLVVRLRRDCLLPEVLVAYLDTTAGRAQLLSNATASTVAAITPRALGSLEVIVPPMPVQMKLATFARAARDAIRASERVLELRRELVQGVMEEFFNGGAVSIDAEAIR